MSSEKYSLLKMNLLKNLEQATTFYVASAKTVSYGKRIFRNTEIWFRHSSVRQF